MLTLGTVAAAVLTLEEEYRRELLEIHETDVAFRLVLQSPALEELHEIATVGLQHLNAPVDGPLERKASLVHPPIIVRYS